MGSQIWYVVKNFLINLFWIVTAFVFIGLLYGLLLSDWIFQIFNQLGNSQLAIGVSFITLATPIFAILEGLISWLRTIKEQRIRTELLKVIDAQSKSPEGMDIHALKRELDLPDGILQERVNELVLLGRLGVKLTPNNNREYYLLM